MEDHYSLVQRIVANPIEYEHSLMNVLVGDYVTLIDADSNLNGVFRLVGKTFTYDEGSFGLEFEFSNSKLRVFDDLAKQQSDTLRLNQYMQGATNIFAVGKTDNAQSGTGAGAIVLRFQIPIDTIAINNIGFSYWNESPRTWGTVTGSGGAINVTSGSGGAINVTSGSGGATTPTSSGGSSHSHTVQVSMNECLGNGEPTWGSAYSGGPWLRNYNSTSGSSESSHTHTVTIGNHTHTVTSSDHTHTVAYSIATQSYTTSDISIYTADDSSTFTDRTSALETIYGTLSSGNGGSETDLDLTSYFTSIGWKAIKLVTNGDSRHEVQANIKCFIQSR